MGSEVQFQAQSFEDGTDKPKPSSSSATDLECSICLDSAQDAVVTFCGHLYCWPCIYKWIHQQQSTSPEEEDRVPQCPVCKAEVSERALVPLYGRGQSNIKATAFGSTIPSRPRGPSFGVQPAALQLQHHGYDHYAAGPEISNAFHPPVISLFGDLIYARPLGNPGEGYGELYGGGSRARRTRVMKADQSLSRLSLFLCCCLLFCLLFF